MAGTDTFLSVDEARERILASVTPLAPVSTGLADAHGLVTAEDVTSQVDVPGFDNSAFDGYALRAADVDGARADAGVSLRVVGEVAAGSAGEVHLQAGTAARIMTGAPIPPGADAVLPFEDTDGVHWAQRPGTGDGHVQVLEAADIGENIRRRGGDVAEGDVVAPEGRVLDAAHIGVLASVDVTEVRVHPRARVAILPTGDEIVEVGDPIAPGQVRNSNAWGLTALARRYGATAERLPIAPDTEAGLRAAIRHGRNADLLVTIGGVSMGDYDLVRNVIASAGRMDFWQINMRPGKPLAFGEIDETPVIGLPGNPVSSMVCFELFVRPALLKLMGHTRLENPMVRPRALEPMRSSAGKRTYVRVTVRRDGDELVCAPAGEQDSFRLTSMTEGNGLAVIPEGAAIQAGDAVSVIALDEREMLLLSRPAALIP
ncbi:MAG: molybdopterin molybdotransferase MoeA [Chloroflexota bacterium]|nr:molybdopterin molybdotransferase MoeA [Chloroflexota bacterium]